MAWKRVKHPSEILEVGQDIEARVLKFDKEKARVSLGIKQMGDDPWKDLARRFMVDTRHYGKVTNITDYGAFVELEDGVEGLVHVSEMVFTRAKYAKLLTKLKWLYLKSIQSVVASL